MSEPENSGESLPAITPSYRDQQSQSPKEPLDEGVAERNLLALADPLEWEDNPCTPNQPRGGKDGIIHYYVHTPEFRRKPRLTQPTSFFIVFHRDDGKAVELTVKGSKAVRRFSTVEEAKAACDCHFATGEWPE